MNTITLRNGNALHIEQVRTDKFFQIILTLEPPDGLVLHWGVVPHPGAEWRRPEEKYRPPASLAVGEGALQSPFAENKLLLELPLTEAGNYLIFVLYDPQADTWDNNRGRNYNVKIRDDRAVSEELGSVMLERLAAEIIEREMGRNSWTLMHRFNLCHDLLDQATDPHGFALIFVWLRYSALRQLDWQRNYNTKPRELTHAQQRLTLKLASRYQQAAVDPDQTSCSAAHRPFADKREMIRLIFSTLGRGAEGGRGQQIRDDILHIMHRHHIKEVTGHFMEEWHQKLHNNATPDDIVICEAYLAFLRSNGELSAFYNTLEQGGVTRERLRSFERPIVTDPDFAWHIKDGLIHDFENYLKLLKSIHSATDLAGAIEAVSHCLSPDKQHEAWQLFHHRHDGAVNPVDRVRGITSLRQHLTAQLGWEKNVHCVRDLLYFDLALEEFLRTATESHLHESLDIRQLKDLVDLLLLNTAISHNLEEPRICADHWQSLAFPDQPSRQWGLHALAVLERVGIILTRIGDNYHHLLQPKAEYLGNAFKAEDWVIELFSQEIVRGGAAFVLSILHRILTPKIRKLAGAGDWQIISRAEAGGEVRHVDLRAVQDQRFITPMILLVDAISGDEEIPPGTVAVLTAEPIDILAHFSVRARNAGILFAVCFDPGTMEEIKGFAGQTLELAVSASGELQWQAGGKHGAVTETAMQRVKIPRGEKPSTETPLILPVEQFSGNLVGGKSLRLKQLLGRLPGWVMIPPSAALPFHVFDIVLADPVNDHVRDRYEMLLKRVESRGKKTLSELQQAIMELTAPEQLIVKLREVLTLADIGPVTDMDSLWRAIKYVWASKWNERAHVSRLHHGVVHADLLMAVLLQDVVPADYAFVIHTINPYSGDADEVYAELVIGLGETLVSGNYPGRALAFTWNKSGKNKPEIVSYPSKNEALVGEGVIARSDSNGEDLEKFAGAGLYDSMLLAPPRRKVIDYAREPIIHDDSFRATMMERIGRIGLAVEQACNDEPQDIEGAFAAGKFYVVQSRTQV